MNKDIIQCRDRGTVMSSEPWKPGQIVNFMWMPAGVHTIVAGFRRGSIELTVQCDESTVEAVQASLDGWRTERPRQECFGCVEHAEREASFRVGASCGFNWKQDGVYLTAEPTVLGAQNINGKIHRSWSPSFTTDAEYSKATEQHGVLVFPEGARGSRSNPARITGCDFCVGTITNRPAFHEIAPVKARESGDAVTAGAPIGNKNAAGPHGDSLHEHLKETGRKLHGHLLSSTDHIANHATDEEVESRIKDESEMFGGNKSVAERRAEASKLHIQLKSQGRESFAEAHAKQHRANYLIASEKSASDSIHAHCAGSHSDGVINIRSKRQNGFVSTTEKPTLDTIVAKAAKSLEAANRIAAEHGAAKLTVADVYERFSVKAGAPLGNKNAARPHKFKAGDIVHVDDGTEHGYHGTVERVQHSDDPNYEHSYAVKKHSTGQRGKWANETSLTAAWSPSSAKESAAAKKRDSSGFISDKTFSATDATPEAILERIYARAGANR